MEPLPVYLDNKEKEKKAENLNDANDYERKGNYFKKIQKLQTKEYNEIAQDLMDICPDPVQYNKALGFLRSGQAVTADEAFALAQEADLGREGDAYPRRKK